MLVIGGDELGAYAFPQELYLVEPVMPMGGNVLLHGKRGLGKTQLATTLALDVLQGIPFMGELATHQGRVAYVQGDMPAKLQQDRHRRIIEVLPSVPHANMRYFFPHAGFDITETDPGEEWAQALRAFAPAMVVVDTLRRSHRLDENSSDTPVAVYSAWREVVGPHATVVYLHHDRKTSFDGGSDRDEEFRGSGAWLDEADLGIHLVRTRGGLVMEWSKARTFAPGEEGVSRSYQLTMDNDTLLLVAASPIDAYMRDAMRRGLPRKQIVESLMDKQRWGKHALPQATAYRRLAGYKETA